MRKKTFKILAPFNAAIDVDALADAGADELYCGYVPVALSRKWPQAFLVVNRRGEGGSFTRQKDFQEASRRALERGLPVHLALNGFYVPEQYDALRLVLAQAESMPGVRSVIVSDLGFMDFMKSTGCSKKIHLSTLSGCFNAMAVRFYEALGVDRVVLDRQLSVAEMKMILLRYRGGIDVEMFVLAGGCGMFIDGMCMLAHCFEQRSGGCGSYKQGSMIDERGCRHVGRLIMRQRLVDPRSFELSGCRLCDLYDLKDMPIRSLKIAGRDAPLKERTRMVAMVAQCVAYLRQASVTRREYRSYCRGIFAEVMLKGQRSCRLSDCCFPEGRYA